MKTEAKKLLLDIVEACQAIQQFNPGGSLADYSANAMRRAATERKFEVIGEAIVRLRELDAPVLAKIGEAPAIIGFRNRLIHGYDSVDDEIVWRVIQEKLPLLLQQAEALLAQPDLPKSK